MFLKNFILSIVIFLIGSQRVLGFQGFAIYNEVFSKHAKFCKNLCEDQSKTQLSVLIELEDTESDEEDHFDDIKPFLQQKYLFFAYFYIIPLKKSPAFSSDKYIYSSRYILLSKSVFQI